MTGPKALWKPEPKPRRKPKGLRRQSAKRAAIAPLRKAFVARILAERPVCEGGWEIGRAMMLKIGEHFFQRWPGCTVATSEVHEVLSRARGGDILDEANVLALCHACHAWVSTHPKLSTSVGLLRSAEVGRGA